MQTILEYIIVFLAAATPWIEVLIAVPFGIIRGLNPVLVSIFSFAGNLLTVFLVVVFYEKLTTWLAKKRKKKNEEDDTKTKRYARAQSIWNKYGLPGLAIGGPILIGSHFTVLIALALGASKKAITWWLIVSLAIWVLAFAITTSYGINLFQLWRG